MPRPWPCLEIADQNGNFAFAFVRHFRQAAHAENFMFACLRVVEIRHQRHFAVVVDEAFLEQSLVVDARTQFLHVEIAEIDGAVGNRLVKFHHQRLIFRSNRANEHLRAVLHGPAPDVLRRVGANGGARKLFGGNIRGVENDAGVERDDSVGRSEQRVDVDFAECAGAPQSAC